MGSRLTADNDPCPTRRAPSYHEPLRAGRSRHREGSTMATIPLLSGGQTDRGAVRCRDRARWGAVLASSQQRLEKSTQTGAVNVAKGASFGLGAACAVCVRRLRDVSTLGMFCAADILRGRRALQAAPWPL